LTPALVVGLGTTACGVVGQCEAIIGGRDWSDDDRRRTDFLFLDTREATGKSTPTGSSFVSLDIPSFDNLQSNSPWITECVPTLDVLERGREGALGRLSYGGLGIRYRYWDVKEEINRLVRKISPIYDGETRVKVHIVCFLGGGTIGALPVLLAALSQQKTATQFEFETLIHLLEPQQNMSRNEYETYQRQLRNAYIMTQFLRVASGATPDTPGNGNNGIPSLKSGDTSYAVTVYPDRVIEARGPHFDHAILHRSPEDDVQVQKEYVARMICNLVADGIGIGADWWGRHTELMRDSTNEVDARFGSLTSRELGILDNFFKSAADKFIQSRWVDDN
jgi:hypothetical protein